MFYLLSFVMNVIYCYSGKTPEGGWEGSTGEWTEVNRIVLLFQC